jgi:hypothetical protein
MHVVCAFSYVWRLSRRNVRLETTGRRFEPGLTIAEFFGCDFTPGRGRRYCDVALHLQSSDASSPWLALITPADLGAGHGRSRERLQVHTRPRLDALDTGTIAAELGQRGGLPARMLRCVEEYIDVHLELSMRELARHSRAPTIAERWHKTRESHK